MAPGPTEPRVDLVEIEPQQTTQLVERDLPLVDQLADVPLGRREVRPSRLEVGPASH